MVLPEVMSAHTLVTGRLILLVDGFTSSSHSVISCRNFVKMKN
jgi:hypothetical protein